MRLPLVVMLISIGIGGCAVKDDQTNIQGLGLAYTSDVKMLENGEYQANAEVAPMAGRTSGAIGTAMQSASIFCKAQNKALKIIKQDTDSHLIINGVSRITFRCV
ncbi:hypothetical protein NLN94_23830 [Citrobacter portucalensis]|uniref:hypothetical protein n=1 Tax=Citrobacter portucalensis TaxID=1639133 RepID=UPI00226B2559|nr:hypothetical protein [Citrobacter portucalensis]MCX9063917.1 hypothetical protein [Citrobacter portucalensis]